MKNIEIFNTSFLKSLKPLKIVQIVLNMIRIFYHLYVYVKKNIYCFMKILLIEIEYRIY